jgi:hypothetical protein
VPDDGKDDTASSTHMCSVHVSLLSGTDMCTC